MTQNGVSAHLCSSLSGRISNFLYRKVWAAAPKSTSKTARFRNASLKILSIVFLKILQDAITFRARGLALTVVLALAPMLALGTAILKGIGVGEETQDLAHRFLDQIVISSASPPGAGSHLEDNLKPETGLLPPSAAGAKGSKQNLVIHLQGMVDKIFGYINQTDFATLGFVGTLAILALVASFLAHLETSMNTIWEVKKGRSVWKRARNYLTVLILLPMAMNLGFAAMAVLQSSTLMAKLEVLLPSPWMVAFLLKMFPALVVAGAFAALYQFLPNTNVSVLHSISGGFLAGISWLLVLLLYINLQLGVARYNAIYGSFATLPLVLLWIYMGWVIFLIGAELVFAFQVWRHYQPWAGMLPGESRMAMAIEVIMVLQEKASSGHEIDVPGLEKMLKYPSGYISLALADLERMGFVKKLKDGGTVTVAKEGLKRGMPGED